jgi:hypothetical protein
MNQMDNSRVLSSFYPAFSSDVLCVAIIQQVYFNGVFNGVMSGLLYKRQ